MIRKAAIDIGTNTTRLLIADLSQNKKFKIIFSRRIITRIGEGLSKHKDLNKKAIQRTIDALKIYSEDIKKYKCLKIRAAATSAVRDADNREEFIQMAKDSTGVQIEVISQKEEARLAAKGILNGLKVKPEKAVCFDVGGGSTEYILVDRNAALLKVVGLPMGIVHLTEKYIQSDPISQKDFQFITSEVKEKLAEVKKQIGHIQGFTLIGTAGTPTQFAALDLNLFPYDHVAVNGHKMSFYSIERIFNELKSKTIDERKAMRAMEQGREDLIIAGGIILIESMRLFNKDEIVISDFGLREGLLLD